jgi:hypothetical protein
MRRLLLFGHDEIDCNSGSTVGGFFVDSMENYEVSLALLRVSNPKKIRQIGE